MKFTSSLTALAIAAVCALSATSASASGLAGCYVRGDVGYGWSASDDATARVTPGGIPATGKVRSAKLDDSWFGEIGIGCSLARGPAYSGSIKDAPVASAPSGLRGDISFGYYGKRDFNGQPVTPPAVVDPVHAKIGAKTLMFNGYYDFPSRHGMTPYIGAGVGVAFIELEDVTFTNGAVVRLGDKDERNFAWSLMAGVATDIGRGMKLDIGYRYLNLGDISISNNCPCNRYSLKIDDLSEHQFRVGLRVPLSFSRSQPMQPLK